MLYPLSYGGSSVRAAPPTGVCGVEASWPLLGDAGTSPWVNSSVGIGALSCRNGYLD
jgi:hypothetical protein